MSFQELLLNEFRPYGTLTLEQLCQLEAHYKLLVQWNRRLNLTRISDLAEVVRFHYCECLFLGTLLPDGPLRICDAGSGAGFPGLPLAVFRPDIEVMLVETDQRKAVFLREATRSLHNAKVSVGRFQNRMGTFNWVVARAVDPQEVLNANIAPNCALLASPAAAPKDSEVIMSPWGKNRAVIVSRGT